MIFSSWNWFAMRSNNFTTIFTLILYKWHWSPFLFLVTTFLKSPAYSHFCYHMTRITCSGSESKTRKLSDLCMCKSYCVSFPCALQDLYYCLYFSFSCFLLDSQQSSFWSIKITSLLPILTVWSHYLSSWSSSSHLFLFPPWNYTLESRCIVFPPYSHSLFQVDLLIFV